MDTELPQTLGYEAAGVVDELGEGVADVTVGDRVFGFCADGAAQAELAVLSDYAPVPPSLDFAAAAALPAAVETATRALDRLGVARGSTLLINGASGSVGSAAVQLAVARGARVIGTASPANHDYLRALGAEPVAYGEGLVERVRTLAPDGVDLALDIAGSGILPELIDLAGGAQHVVTIADFAGAREHGVTFSRGDDGRAMHALAEIGELIESGRFTLPDVQTFPLAEIAPGASGRRERSPTREARAARHLMRQGRTERAGQRQSKICGQEVLPGLHPQHQQHGGDRAERRQRHGAADRGQAEDEDHTARYAERGHDRTREHAHDHERDRQERVEPHDHAHRTVVTMQSLASTGFHDFSQPAAATRVDYLRGHRP